MNSLPHGPLSLIVDFIWGCNISLLPILHTCTNLKEMNQDNLLLQIGNVDRFSLGLIQFYLSQGATLTKYLRLAIFDRTVQECNLLL
jgi:hypothetical protein